MTSLDELEALLEKATPGPWIKGDWRGQCHIKHAHSGPPECKYDYTIDTKGDSGRCLSIGGPEDHVTLVGWNEWGPVLSAEDTALIAALRNAAPSLIAAAREGERMREALEEVRAACILPPQVNELVEAALAKETQT